MKIAKKFLQYLPHIGIFLLLLTEYYAPENVRSYFKAYAALYLAMIAVIYLLNLFFKDKMLHRILWEGIYLMALIISLRYDSEVPLLQSVVIVYPLLRIIQLSRNDTQ